jgi:hypothetical protein
MKYKDSIILKICNKKDECGTKRCVHNKPHQNHSSCVLQRCFDKNFKSLHVRCLNHQYQLMEKR